MKNTNSEGVMFSTKQQTIFNWINDKLRLPVYAEAYKGALDLLDRKSPGYITFVSHAGRDLMNGLVREIRGIKPKSVDYKDPLDELQKEWKDEWGAGELNEIDDTEGGHLIPHEICKKIKELIDKHKAGRLRASEVDNLFFSTFLGYDDSVRIGPNFFQEWKVAKKWFLAHTHLRKGKFELDASSEIEKHFRMLDNLLYDAAISEFGRMRIINEILEEANE